MPSIKKSQVDRATLEPVTTRPASRVAASVPPPSPVALSATMLCSLPPIAAGLDQLARQFYGGAVQQERLLAPLAEQSSSSVKTVVQTTAVTRIVGTPPQPPQVASSSADGPVRSVQWKRDASGRFGGEKRFLYQQLSAAAASNVNTAVATIVTAGPTDPPNPPFVLENGSAGANSTAGTVTMFHSAPLGNWIEYAEWRDFALDFPFDDADVTAIYCVATAYATGTSTTPSRGIGASSSTSPTSVSGFFGNGDAVAMTNAGGASLTITSKNISSVTAVSGFAANLPVRTVTVVTTSAHGFLTNDSVTIAGVTDSSFDGTFSIIVLSPTSFSYVQTSTVTETTSSGGTVIPALRGAAEYRSVNLLTLTGPGEQFDGMTPSQIMAAARIGIRLFSTLSADFATVSIFASGVGLEVHGPIAPASENGVYEVLVSEEGDKSGNYVQLTTDGRIVATGGVSGPLLDGVTEADFILSDVPTANVTNLRHGLAPKSPGDATYFLNGAATPAYAQVKDSDLSLSAITTNNVNSTRHGLAPVSPGDATKFLNGAATPAYALVKDSDLSLSDITTNNASITKHGFLKKLPNDATKFLDGTGAFSDPPAGTPTTTLGDIIYRGASVDLRLAGNTVATRKFLRQLGTGSVSAAPAWDTLLAADIPNIAESQVTNLVSDLAAKASTAYADAAGAAAAAASLPAVARSTVNVVTAVLATSAAQTGTVALGKQFLIVKVEVSCKCRVQLYATAALRTADATRSDTTPPTLYTQHGVLLDFATNDAAVLAWVMSPPAVGANCEAVPSANISYRITNYDSSQAVTVTFTRLPLET